MNWDAADMSKKKADGGKAFDGKTTPINQKWMKCLGIC
jgi:hypothetical protein